MLHTCCSSFVCFLLIGSLSLIFANCTLYCGVLYGDGDVHFTSTHACWNFNNASFMYPGIDNVTVLFFGTPIPSSFRDKNLIPNLFLLDIGPILSLLDIQYQLYQHT